MPQTSTALLSENKRGERPIRARGAEPLGESAEREILAPRAGLEPATGWLTATCSTN